MKLAARASVAALVAGVLLVGTPAYSLTLSHGVGASSQARWAPARDRGWSGHGFDPTNPASCDPIDPAQCMLPYPNDWWTHPDPTAATGRRLDLTLAAMPRNVAGKPINPADYNRSDGFSAGSQILTVVPGMTSNADLAPSGLPPVTDLAANDAPNLGVILLDADTGKRWPVWVEVDQYVAESGLEGAIGAVQHDLMIHPAKNLADGHRYIVALRHLVTDKGAIAPPSSAFAAYRDGSARRSDPRAAHMEGIFRALGRVGWSRSSLFLAWDFTTASTANVTGRLLAIRDDAFHQLGDTHPGDAQVDGRAPAFSVDSVTDFAAASDPRVARQITGHFTVPCYITPTCSLPVKCSTVTAGVFNDCPTPGQFALPPGKPDALPRQVAGQTYQANFVCEVGRPAYQAHVKLRPVEYGHGLFGGAGEVSADPQKEMAAHFGMLYCATDWIGMASADVPNAAAALTDLSRFPWLADRVQQGELDFLYLARLLVHPSGFSSNPAFRWSDGRSFIDTSGVYYDGNSQGGIYGGTVCAVSIDVRRCALGVPGMDYSILLPRSSDYVASQPLTPARVLSAVAAGGPTSAIGYSDIFDTAYPQQSQRMLILDLIQTLWDRADPNGYATHMTGGLPGTPTHQVLLQVAYGDHQVANIAAEDEARTIGAAGVYPPLVARRYGSYHDVFWGIPAAPGFPYAGSAITLFDSGPAMNKTPQGHLGTDPPPVADVPNRSGEDPHEAPRTALCGQDQKAAFLAPQGAVTAPCGGGPYFSFGWNGSTGLS
ncbi:MAG: hypothetical protein ACR2KC_07105 [Acidimicrobiales bacterium]